jgi:hypothetical protein
MALALDMPKVIQNLRSAYYPPVVFILPLPRNLICYYCFTSLSNTNWKTYADHYKTHSKATEWNGQYKDPFGPMWTDLYGHFFYLGTNISGLRESFFKYQWEKEKILEREYSRQYRIRNAAKTTSSPEEEDIDIFCNPQLAKPLNLLPLPRK